MHLLEIFKCLCVFLIHLLKRLIAVSDQLGLYVLCLTVEAVDDDLSPNYIDSLLVTSYFADFYFFFI